MRLLVALSIFGLLAGCAGDSSLVMSVWNGDAGTPSSGSGGTGYGGGAGHGGQGPVATGGRGGNGGILTGGKGGTGGSVTITIPIATGGSAGATGGSVSVRGGTRDVATGLCTATSNGGGCPVGSTFLQCLQGFCGSYINDCYQGTSGVCADYAACMLACPCDSGRSACESDCLQNQAYGSTTCGPCIVQLLSCWSSNGCLMPVCNDSGSSTGQAGSAGSGGGGGVAGSVASPPPPVAPDAGPIIKLDASPKPYPDSGPGTTPDAVPRTDLGLPDRYVTVDLGLFPMPVDVAPLRSEVALARREVFAE